MILPLRFTDTEHDRGVNFEDMVNFMDFIKDPVELPNGLIRVSMSWVRLTMNT